MEKLVYVVWKDAAIASAHFREAMLGETARAILAHGTRGLTVNLADDHAVLGLRIGHRNPTGTVSVWMDTARARAPIESALAAVAARVVGYLALESVPLVNTRYPTSPGERIPGLYNVAFLERPDNLGYDEWLARWQDAHTQVAIETQSTFLYVQNVLVRALTPDAPPWAAIVEEAFPAEAATDPMVFYAADSPATLAAHQQRMMESCRGFIDFSRLETHPMSSYVIREAWAQPIPPAPVEPGAAPVSGVSVTPRRGS